MVKRKTKRPLPGGEAPPQAVVRGASGQVRFPEPEKGKAFEYPLIRQLRLQSCCHLPHGGGRLMVKRKTKRPLPGGEAPPQAVMRGASGQSMLSEREKVTRSCRHPHFSWTRVFVSLSFPYICARIKKRIDFIRRKYYYNYLVWYVHTKSMAGCDLCLFRLQPQKGLS